MREENKNVLSVVVGKRKMQMVKWGVILGLILVVVLTAFLKGRASMEEKYTTMVDELKAEVERLSEPTAEYTVATEEVSLDLIQAEIKDIGELATVEYMYSDAGKFEDTKKMFNLDVLFTTKSFIAKWDGIIKAGVKVEEITVELNDANKEILVHMPKAVILSHEIDTNSIKTLDEKDGLFNPVKVEDVRNFDAISKESMEERAIENGILDNAYENARGIIEKLINTDVVKEQGYSIRFEEVV